MTDDKKKADEGLGSINEPPGSNVTPAPAPQPAPEAEDEDDGEDEGESPRRKPARKR